MDRRIVGLFPALLLGLAEALDLIGIHGFSMPTWAMPLNTHGKLIGYGLVNSFALL